MSNMKDRIETALTGIFIREGFTRDRAVRKAKKYADQMHSDVNKPTTTTKTVTEAVKPAKVTLKKKIAGRISDSTDCHGGIRRRLFESLVIDDGCHKGRRGHC